ncbi:NUDIX domain-containing protein [Pseudoduganella sp. DS3]|uniref:NUDIX domain-containing protein n=1 Tax=Pseudoduganella guangdongensis TaxID=2692179 RepID=A0A6N9HBY3_9BURK|nr:NUDIX domain-containing protein [Pseudoduganella guangdongensis]MYN01028.1 NUDIX domain-containing protein [Pseudoduganella guangdongensis]
MQQVICTVDVVLLTLQDDALKVALLNRSHEPFQGVAALPGGYIHPQSDGDAQDAALRVLREKTGITPPYLEQLATFSGPARDPRGWSVSIVYYALVPANVVAENVHPGVKLTSVDKPLKLPFDHLEIIRAAVARLRSKSQYSSLPCYLAGETFTLPQLQRVYESLMGEAINKVSFRRKITEMDMLEAVEGVFSSGVAHRPAQLYRLKPEIHEQLALLARGM